MGLTFRQLPVPGIRSECFRGIGNQDCFSCELFQCDRLAGHKTVARTDIGIYAVPGQERFPGPVRKLRIAAGAEKYIMGAQHRKGHGT